MSKVLFILKKREIYSEDYYSSVNSGLFNSATFVNDMLIRNGIDSHLVEVVDNNEIDKVVTEHKPDTVIIEALWVVPEKFEILQKLHPNVKWMIRLHSEIPFIANEGVAIQWLKGYKKYENVIVSSNSKVFIDSMEPVLGYNIVYTPNYYQITKPIDKQKDKDFNVGLFGAIRPMKNCLTQAVAAMTYANKHGKKLRLHINTERVEQKGENVLKNIRALFENTPHELVEHKWLKHSEFLQLVSTMDIGLQVSLSETYNIVSADFVNQEIPIITSSEVPFVCPWNQVKVTKDASAIVRQMRHALGMQKPFFIKQNKVLLKLNSEYSEEIWRKLFK